MNEKGQHLLVHILRVCPNPPPLLRKNISIFSDLINWRLGIPMVSGEMPHLQEKKKYLYMYVTEYNK